MKKVLLNLTLSMVGLLVAINLGAQDWMVMTKNGSHMLKAQKSNGVLLDVIAMSDEGDDCFMDIRAVENGHYYSIKLIASDSMQIPVMAVKDNGSTMNIIAVASDGEIYQVKGVSRFGNTIKIVGVTQSGSFKELVAKASDGRTKSISGIKFEEENVELQIGQTKIIAHLKAMPQNLAMSEETVWDVKAIGNDGSHLDVVAVNKNKEYPIKAMSAGGSFTLLNVKALSPRDNMAVKLTKNEEGIFLTSIDEYGREFPVNIKMPDGKYIRVHGGDNCGKTIDIQTFDKKGIHYLLHAISPEGDIYDLKGIKVKDEDTEGFIQGLKGLTLYYAHVKALPPVQ
jgi:hypothetical protein